MRVNVTAFARLRELLGRTETIELPEGATVAAAWNAIAQKHPALTPYESSTRIARNDRIAASAEVLSEGDRLALLPPSSGG